MQEASEAARGKKLPSRVYLSIDGLERGPRAGTPWGRMLRQSNTVSAKTIKNYVGEVRPPSSQPPEAVNIRVRTV